MMASWIVGSIWKGKPFIRSEHCIKPVDPRCFRYLSIYNICFEAFISFHEVCVVLGGEALKGQQCWGLSAVRIAENGVS